MPISRVLRRRMLNCKRGNPYAKGQKPQVSCRFLRHNFSHRYLRLNGQCERHLSAPSLKTAIFYHNRGSNQDKKPIRQFGVRLRILAYNFPVISSICFRFREFRSFGVFVVALCNRTDKWASAPPRPQSAAKLQALSSKLQAPSSKL